MRVLLMVVTVAFAVGCGACNAEPDPDCSEYDNATTAEAAVAERECAEHAWSEANTARTLSEFRLMEQGLDHTVLRGTDPMEGVRNSRESETVGAIDADPESVKDFDRALEAERLVRGFDGEIKTAASTFEERLASTFEKRLANLLADEYFVDRCHESDSLKGSEGCREWESLGYYAAILEDFQALLYDYPDRALSLTEHLERLLLRVRLEEQYHEAERFGSPCEALDLARRAGDADRFRRLLLAYGGQCEVTVAPAQEQR